MRLPAPLLASALLFAACGTDAPTAGEDVATPDETTAPSVRTQGSYTVWETAPNPESVEIDGARVYAGHFGPELAPTQQDGNGYIAVYNADGTLVDTLVAGLDAPKGLEAIGSTLYVADVDTLFGFSTADGRRTLAVSFTGWTSFLNGLDEGPDGSLLVTATDAGKLYRVDPNDGTIAQLADVTGANGVVYDASANRAIVVGYVNGDPDAGHVYSVDLATNEATRLGDYAGTLDGVAIAGDSLVFTDWAGGPGGQGAVVKAGLRDGGARVLATDELFSGPADFDLLGDGVAIVPMLTGSRIVAVRLR